MTKINDMHLERQLAQLASCGNEAVLMAAANAFVAAGIGPLKLYVGDTQFCVTKEDKELAQKMLELLESKIAERETLHD